MLSPYRYIPLHTFTYLYILLQISKKNLCRYEPGSVLNGRDVMGTYCSQDVSAVFPLVFPSVPSNTFLIVSIN